jgi:hypothetical protein
VLRVVEAVSPEAKVVAALHDAIEDGGLTLLDVPFAIKRTEWTAIKLLTRPPQMGYADYIDSIAEGCNTMPETRRIAREVKLADLHDNLSRIPREPRRESETLEQERWLWGEKWASLKARYEKAIATLATPISSDRVSER